jgi:hypothetical protein
MHVSSKVSCWFSVKFVYEEFFFYLLSSSMVHVLSYERLVLDVKCTFFIIPAIIILSCCHDFVPHEQV